MRTVQTALVLAMIGVVLCLWLLVDVRWYSFIAFMVVAQPLLLLAVVLFAAAVVKRLRERDAAEKE